MRTCVDHSVNSPTRRADAIALAKRVLDCYSNLPALDLSNNDESALRELCRRALRGEGR